MEQDKHFLSILFLLNISFIVLKIFLRNYLKRIKKMFRKIIGVLESG